MQRVEITAQLVELGNGRGRPLGRDELALSGEEAQNLVHLEPCRPTRVESIGQQLENEQRRLRLQPKPKAQHRLSLSHDCCIGRDGTHREDLVWGIRGAPRGVLSPTAFPGGSSFSENRYLPQSAALAASARGFDLLRISSKCFDFCSPESPCSPILLSAKFVFALPRRPEAKMLFTSCTVHNSDRMSLLCGK